MDGRRLDIKLSCEMPKRLFSVPRAGRSRDRAAAAVPARAPDVDTKDVDTLASP